MHQLLPRHDFGEVRCTLCLENMLTLLGHVLGVYPAQLKLEPVAVATWREQKHAVVGGGVGTTLLRFVHDHFVAPRRGRKFRVAEERWLPIATQAIHGEGGLLERLATLDHYAHVLDAQSRFALSS